MSFDPSVLPPDLPVPIDDGACDHLVGVGLPDLDLPSTSGSPVNLRRLPGRAVVFCYPRTGRPGEDPPAGWDQVPGARGCTPESCGFRDNFPALQRLAVRVYGLSTQDTGYQRELVDRLHLPYEVLSDHDLRFAAALRLPTFQIAGMTLIKRLTLVIDTGALARVIYPVFPPDGHAAEVVATLSAAAG
jgi:peroxiredoxin